VRQDIELLCRRKFGGQQLAAEKLHQIRTLGKEVQLVEQVYNA
jgi:hypothetical protein